MRRAVPMGILASLAMATTAQASPSARLVYARSAEALSCPDETALRKAVAARFGYDPFFPWAKQTVVVQISRDTGRFLARVQIVDDGGIARGTREIVTDEDSCSELFDAAALAISIALDASAAVTPPAALQEEAPPPPATVPPPISEPPLPVAALPPREASAQPLPTPPSRLRMGIDAVATAFVTPNVAPGIAAFGEYRVRSFSLGLELAASAAPLATINLAQRDPGSAKVGAELYAVTLAPCAHLGHAFVCALASLGSLHAHEEGLTHGRSDDAPFVAAGGRVGAEWPLAGELMFHLHADLLADLTPPTFLLDGQPWRAGVGAGALGMGIGAPFP